MPAIETFDRDRRRIAMVLDATATITEDGVAELRRRVGYYYEPRRSNTTATPDNIRRFCDAIGDTNPLHRDPNYAKDSEFGGIIAPPTFLYSVIHPSGMRAGGLPGVHAFHSGNEWEWYGTIRTGDVITGTYRPVHIAEKTSRMGGESVIVYAEIIYRNQWDEDIARVLGWTIRVERRQSQERGKYSNIKPKTWNDHEIQMIFDAYDEEQRSIRGREPRYWEDVQPGDELPRTVKGPLTLSDMVAWAGIGMAAAHSMRVQGLRRHPGFTFRDPNTGALEVIARVHENPEAAASAGVPGAYDIGAQRNAWLGTLLTNWMGDSGRLLRLYAEYRRFNIYGDIQWGRGKVVRKRVDRGQHLVDLDIWFENQDGVVTTPGSATVALPSRNGA
jgi:acyl dehydratase